MFTLTIETDNDAFNPYVSDELMLCLERVVASLEDVRLTSIMPWSTGVIRDTNGNTVGKWELRP